MIHYIIIYQEIQEQVKLVNKCGYEAKRGIFMIFFNIKISQLVLHEQLSPVSHEFVQL